MRGALSRGGTEGLHKVPGQVCSEYRVQKVHRRTYHTEIDARSGGLRWENLKDYPKWKS